MLNNLKSTLKSNIFANTMLLVLVFRFKCLVGIFPCLSKYIDFSKKKVLLHSFLPLGSLSAALFFLLWKTSEATKKQNLMKVQLSYFCSCCSDESTGALCNSAWRKGG